MIQTIVWFVIKNNVMLNEALFIELSVAALSVIMWSHIYRRLWWSVLSW